MNDLEGGHVAVALSRLELTFQSLFGGKMPQILESALEVKNIPANLTVEIQKAVMEQLSPLFDQSGQEL